MPAVPFPGFKAQSAASKTQGPFTIVLLEDDYGQMEIYQEIAQANAGYVEIVPYYSEGEFRDAFLSGNQRVVHGYVFDLFVRWERPGCDVHFQRPAGHRWPSDEAGLRCKDLVRETNNSVPVVIWTAIQTDHMDPQCFNGSSLFKKSESEFEKILRHLYQKSPLAIRH